MSEINLNTVQQWLESKSYRGAIQTSYIPAIIRGRMLGIEDIMKRIDSGDLVTKGEFISSMAEVLSDLLVLCGREKVAASALVDEIWRRLNAYSANGGTDTGE